GALSEKIGEIKEFLLGISASLAAWADYPDDDVPQIDEKKLDADLEQGAQRLKELLATFDSGRILRDGVNTVIAGRPNAGKSTLMNLLSGCERSIVTNFAGTTRDVVEESVLLGDIPLRLSDTAGIRDTHDPVERIGVRLAKEKVDGAELILAVFDASEELTEDDRNLIAQVNGKPAIAVVNKSDLESKNNIEYIAKHFNYIVYISALKGEGIEALREAVEQVLHTGDLHTEEGILCTERQRDSARRALDSVVEALDAHRIGLTLDAVTVSLEGAVGSLLELTGEKVGEAVVASVFEHFCVGK
ncbi:MAG: GTP-binding protein, partial [Oscillospiraceae bacterium]